MKILHYMPDDKFLDAAMTTFDAVAPGVNEYYLWNRASKSELRYIKDVHKIYGYAPWGTTTCDELVSRCREKYYAGVILHSWPGRHFAKAIRGFGVPIFLFTWGHEIYDVINKQDYLPLTQKAMRREGGLAAQVRNAIHKIKHAVGASRWFPSDGTRAFIGVDYICPVLEDDYFLLKKKFGSKLKAEMMPFNYSTGRTSVPQPNAFHADGSIFVGNSETWTNNHLDVFEKLRALGVKNDVYAPLSYGNAPFVRDAVIAGGKAMLGAQFHPIVDFLPYAEYSKLVASSSYMVMGHLRQQAIGNINIGFSNGMKVFLDDRNPSYAFYVRHGFKVFPFNKIRSGEEFMMPITVEEQRQNCQALYDYWNSAIIQSHVRDIVERIVQ